MEKKESLKIIKLGILTKKVANTNMQMYNELAGKAKEDKKWLIFMKGLRN